MAADGHGGTGNYQNIGDCVAWLREINPRRVLDIGVGFGRWGFLVRDFLEIWNGRHGRDQWKVELVGVEAFAGNIREHHRLFYDEIVTETAQEYLARSEDAFDLIILGDVLEHFTPDDGRRVLAACLERGAYVLLVLPIGDQWPQDDIYGNRYERHLAFWREQDLGAFHPRVLVRYRDYVDRPFVAGVLSRDDPRDIAGQLQDVTVSPPHRLVRFAEPTPAATGEAPAAAPLVSADGRMHIALVTREFPPFFGGGIGTYYRHLARLLGEAGHRVSVFTEDHGAPPAMPNVDVHRWRREESRGSGSGVTDWLAENMRWGRWLSGALADVHAAAPLDVIEVTDYYLDELFLDAGGLVTADGAPLPIVTQFHGPRSLVVGLDGLRNAPLLSKLEHAVLTAAPFRKTYSPRMATQVDELWPGARCAFVPAAFYPWQAGPVERDAGQAPLTDLVYFGRLQRFKGLDRLAEALCFAAQGGLRPEVLLVGRDTNTAPDEGSMARWLERTLRPALGERVRLIDAMPPNALWSVLQRARLVVLPSIWESLGFTVLESFCSGTPTLCSHLAGAAYILSGELMQRTVVDVREAERFAARIETSLACSDTERAVWADGLRDVTLRHFAPDRIEAKVTDYYRACRAQAAERMAPARRDAEVRQRILAIIDDIVRIAHARRSDMERLERELGELRAGADRSGAARIA